MSGAGGPPARGAALSEASGDKKVESKGPSALCLSGGVKEVEWEPARDPEGREHIEVRAIRRGNAWEIDSGERELLGDVRSILEAAAEVATARGASEDARPD